MGGKTVTFKGRQKCVLNKAAKLAFSSGRQNCLSIWVVNIKVVKMLFGKENLGGKNSGDQTVAAQIHAYDTLYGG